MGFLAMVQSVIGPWIFMGLAASYLPGALIRLFKSEGLLSLFSWPRVQTAWFGAFWNYVGRQIREGNNDKILALLQGRVSQGAAVQTPQHQPLNGTVLDIGPGLGFWVDIYAAFNSAVEAKATRSRSAQPGKLKIYGVEPSTDAHPHLTKSIEAAGLDGVYKILPVGIQSIAEFSDDIEEGSVDCIVSLLCLCSIPDPEDNIRELYKLLKPGGRWYLYEHVRVKRSVIVRIYQATIGLIWPYFIGGCQIGRDTEASLRRAGHWTTIDIAQPAEETWHGVLPHIYGILTK